MGAALQGDSGALDALRTTRRDLPLLGAGYIPEADRPTGGAPHHSGAPHGVHPRCVAREPPAGRHHTPGGIMKLIIAGSRTFTDYQRLCQVLAPERHRITQVLTGGARGADALGKRWAWSKQVPWKGFKAEWER